MTDITPNEKAFIKVSQDLLRARNDVLALQAIVEAAGQFNQWNRTKLSEHRPDRHHTDEYLGISKALYLMGHAGEANNALTKAKGKVEALERLSEAYMRGENIIQAKLASE